MSIKLIAGVLLAAVLVTAGAVNAFSGPGQDEGMPSPEEMNEMMAQWAALGTPGPDHAHLEAFVGTWKTTTRMWMAPDAPPVETQGRSVVEWVLGGRYIQERMTSTLMLPDPENPAAMKSVPYEGLGFTGYDNYRNVYVGSWMDNQGTQFLTFRGSRHPATGLFTFYGEMDEPYLKVAGRTVKYRNEIKSENEHVFSIYDLHVADDYKVMEIVYKRADS